MTQKKTSLQNQIDSEFETKKNRVIVREEKLPLFGDLCNANRDIFVVPTQEGADKDDNWNGSIGDATLEHIDGMRHRAHEMEHFYMAPDGNLFRTEANVSFNEDSDRGQKKRLLDAMTIPTGPQLAHDEKAWKEQGIRKLRVVTEEDKENLLGFLMEELQEQRDRRESDDALDQTLVAFEDWEDMPQMTKHIDIPSTPPPLYIYAGNCSQMFYDWFPEDHPDKNLINQLLMMINSIDWDDFQIEQVEYFLNWLEVPDTKMGSARRATRFQHFYAEERLKGLIYKLHDEENVRPEVMVKEALVDIDQDWGRLTHKRAVKLARQNPILQEIEDFEKQLRQKHDRGELIWREIGAFGQKLWKKYGAQNINAYHWARYSQLKVMFAPRVLVSGRGRVCDLNRANIWEVEAVMGSEFARWAFTARPFFSVEDLIQAGKLTIDNLGYTNNNVALVSMLQGAAKKARKTSNIRLVTGIAQQVVDKQKMTPNMMTPDEWTQVWQAYRVAKDYASKPTTARR